MSSTWNFTEFYERKRKWSLETFGPAQTTAGLVAHMRSEVIELRTAIAKPGRRVRVGEIDAICEELSDICLLALDMSWRAGGYAADFGEISGDCDHITPANAARYVDLHLATIADGAMPPRAGAVVIWDIAFRALACNPKWIERKFAALQLRTWPDWRTVPADQPIEHVREESATRRGDDAIAEELVAPLLAERSAMAAAIAKLTAEVDGLRLLDESNRLEMERVRAALHAKKDEATSVAAARVWGELLAAEGRGRDVLSALGRPVIEDPVKAAQRIVRERDELAEQLTKERGTADDLTRRHNALYPERVSKERAEWLANNEALRLERDDVRKVLDARPHETVARAAQRVVNLSATRRVYIESMEKRLARSIRRDTGLLEALGVSGDLPLSAIVERAGQLRDDSVAYRSLRGRLVDMLGCPADFSEKDVADLIADRISGPITDAEDDLVEQVQQLEGDVTTLKAALHVATRGQS